MYSEIEVFDFVIAVDKISNPDDGAGRTQELTK